MSGHNLPRRIDYQPEDGGGSERPDQDAPAVVPGEDSESFAKYKIPRITIHSVTQQTWPILHSSKDKLDEIKMDDYYASYRLMAGYLAFLDTDLGHTATPQGNPSQ